MQTDMSTAISAAGVYPGGDYHIVNSITTGINNTSGYAYALEFSGAFTLDLNGMTLANNAGGGSSGSPILSVGVCSAYTGKIYDSSGGNGRIKGFRIGVKLDGASSKLLGCNLSENLYAGAWLDGADALVRGGVIGDIGGVADEPYATGILFGGADPSAIGVRFGELYRQTGYTGSAAGEGLAINFAAVSSGTRTMRDCICVNSEIRSDVIGVFLGGNNTVDVVEHNIFENMRYIGIAVSGSRSTPPVIRRNLIRMTGAASNSYGISVTTGQPSDNVIVGYETAIYGASVADNIVAGFPASSEWTCSLQSDAGGWSGNYVTRIVIPANTITISGTSVVLTLRAANGNVLVASNAWIGRQATSGNVTDMNGSHSRLKFSGNDGVTIAAGTELASDSAAFTFDHTKAHVVHVQHNNAAIRVADNVGSCATYYKAGTDDGSSVLSGMTVNGANRVAHVAKIEVS